MKKNVIEIWVGLFAALGIAAIIFLALNVANITQIGKPSDSYTVTASFTNIGGLKVKAPVKVAGVVVGRVEKIYLDDDFNAEVAIRLEKNYKFSADTSAQIFTSGILGEQYIGLLQGGEEEELEEGSKILYTNSAFVLEELINKFIVNVLDKNAEPSVDSSAEETI